MFIARLEEVLFLMAEEIHRMQIQGIRVQTDHPEFLAGLEVMIPAIMRTRSEEKRRRFALLLAHTAVEMDPAARDQGQNMAILLEQLDEHDILLLRRVTEATTEEEIDERIGRVRWARWSATGYQPEIDGPSWLRLHSMNLLTEGDRAAGGISLEDDAEPIVGVTSLGLLLGEWIAQRGREGESSD
jgi:hypothetical protein